MLRNTFTPSEVAVQPDDFFGRSVELKTLEASLLKGSAAIQGAIGIGKSSLLARARLHMEGFISSHRSKCVIAVCEKEIETADEAARLILESMVDVDERQNRLKFKLGSIVEKESVEVCRQFVEGRHLAALLRILETDYLKSLLSDREFFLIAVDEADKCPVPLARLIRKVVTHTQQQGVKEVRFLLAGVSPFFGKMVDEDRGVDRFFYRAITLLPMPEDEAVDLVETKLLQVIKLAEEDGIAIRVEPDLVSRIVFLSGGHPHVLQLLGSHVVERENEDPDGVIDSKDLVNSLRRICYEDRAHVYSSTVHMLEARNMYGDLETLLRIARRGFPTRIDRRAANREVGEEAVQWLVENNILIVASKKHYGLVDEFLRIRLLLDRLDRTDQDRFEQRIIKSKLPRDIY